MATVVAAAGLPGVTAPAHAAAIARPATPARLAPTDGTIVYEHYVAKDGFDDLVPEIWARDADGSNARLVASPHYANLGDPIGFRHPAVALSGTDVYFHTLTLGNSTNWCNLTTCVVHYGFELSGISRWRQGQVTELTGRPAYCYNCSTWTEMPTVFRDGRWAAWHHHYQEATTWRNLPVLGQADGSNASLDGASPCDSEQAMGPMAADPVDPFLAFTACALGDEQYGVFVTTPDLNGGYQTATVPVVDYSGDPERLALGWTLEAELIVRRADASPGGDGFYLYDPSINDPAQQTPEFVLNEPAGVIFGRPSEIPGGLLLFHAENDAPEPGGTPTFDLWTVPVACRGCSFPQDATRLTFDGRSRSPSFTTAHRFDQSGGGGGSSFGPLVPGRLFDSRSPNATIDGAQSGEGLRAAGSITTINVAGRAGVPANAAAVSLNVTVADPQGAGYATVWPCDAPQPTASNLNYTPGTNVPNAVLTKLSASGTVCVYTYQPIHLVADVNGYFG